MKLSASFRDASGDYLHLLERGYSSGQILPLVSSRYQLSATESSMLYRGVFTKAQSSARLKKLVSSPTAPLHIDGFNVLITIASYLQGLPVFLACDGCLRDAAYVRGNIQKITNFDRAAMMLLQSLNRINGKHTIYLDREVALHKQIAALLEQPNDLKLVIAEKVDEKLISIAEGVLCSSDTEIIEMASVAVFDLARYVITHHFEPDFFDLEAYLSPG
jgi:hypothetical protein